MPDTAPTCGAVMPRTTPDGLCVCQLAPNHDGWHRCELFEDGLAVWRDDPETNAGLIARRSSP